MNMFKASKAQSVDEYLAEVPPERQDIMYFMHDFIQKTVPELEVHFANNMLGYGKFSYTDYKKREINWPTISLGNHKQYVSLYVCSIEDGEYLAEKYADKLGKVSVGKSCIRLKKLEDVNLDELKVVVQKAAKKPGFDGLGASKN